MGPDEGTGTMQSRARRNTNDPDTRPETEAQRPSTQEQTQEGEQCAAISQSEQQQPRVAVPQGLSSGSSTRTPTPANVSGASPPPRVDPPITKHTLSELDVAKIIHNSKLRHDINFDPELHFRPNTEGDKGRKKAHRSNLFWNSLKDQLGQFVLDREGFYAQFGDGNDWCLPVLLKTIKDILETLVPQCDREFLEEGLNVDLLMQQFHRGVLDLEKLAEWLSNVLKSHCAPMRDEEVDQMFNLVQNGNRNNDLDSLVRGMQLLLSILEHMKLDVANHQIRCLRPVLIQDTVHFEQRCFYKKLQSGRLNIDGSKEWYRLAKQQYKNDSRSFGQMTVFFEALSRLVMPSSGNKIPETFQHDQERLLKFRAEVKDAVNLEICMQLYRDLERVPRQSSHFGGFQDGAGSRTSSGSLSADFNLDAPATGSRPSSLTFSNSDSSSPRSSLTMPSYLAFDQNESKERARELYNSLVAILFSANHSADQNARWQSIAPSMAVEIFRFLDAPSEMLPQIESVLMTKLARPEEAEEAFHLRLMDDLSARVSELKGLSGINLYSAVAEKRSCPGSANGRDFFECLRDGQEEGVLDDMATRLSHVGILHWRTWAALAYDEE